LAWSPIRKALLKTKHVRTGSPVFLTRAEIVIPEIADYEVRRELVRAGKDRGIGRLDALKGMIAYAAITTPVMLKAAEFWATARKMGR